MSSFSRIILCLVLKAKTRHEEAALIFVHQISATNFQKLEVRSNAGFKIRGKNIIKTLNKGTYFGTMVLIPLVEFRDSLKHLMLIPLLPMCLWKYPYLYQTVANHVTQPSHGSVLHDVLWVSYGTISQEIIISHLFIGYVHTRTSTSSPG